MRFCAGRGGVLGAVLDISLIRVLSLFLRIFSLLALNSLGFSGWWGDKGKHGVGRVWVRVGGGGGGGTSLWAGLLFARVS